jgi:hypothetical protein
LLAVLSIGEAFSDSVGRLLSTNGGSFPELTRLTRRDAGFEAFVVKHLDETVPADMLKVVLLNVKRNCPRSAIQLCRKLRAAAQ